MKKDHPQASDKKRSLNLLPCFCFTFLFFVHSLPETNCNKGNNCFSGSSITIPASDNTPPSTVLDVHISGKPLISVTSTSSADSTNIADTDTITFIAKGSDPEGIKDIQIWVEETRWYNGSTPGPGLLGAPEVHNIDNGTVGSKGCTERVASLNFFVKPRRKQATNYRVRLWATAINFTGTKTNSATVVLTWP